MEKRKKKILIDLDILTVSLWDGKKEAMAFLNRIKKGEFDLYVPYTLLGLAEKWDNIKLKNKIMDFYKKFSTKILTAENYLEKIDELGVDEKKVVKKLEENHIKDEDIALIIITSIFELDFLITYNRRHLKNKELIINEVLRKNGLRTIKILLPNEL